MDKRQKERALYKSWKKGYYHLCTDGKKATICYDEEEYVNAVNAISILDLLFPVKVHSYEVMRSHIHLLLSGSGAACVAVFDYLTKRINKRLCEDGHPRLPDNYGFRLIPVESEGQMCNNYVYIGRNASEVKNIRPGTYLWGSSYIFYSELPRLMEGVRAGTFSVHELRQMFRTHRPIPKDRLIHPGLKMALPQSFVDTRVFYKVFPTATEYETRLVKDYESFVEIADLVGEDVNFTMAEAVDIVDQEMKRAGLQLENMTRDERCRLAVQFHRKFRLDALTLSEGLLLPVHIVTQALQSKRYGK